MMVPTRPIIELCRWQWNRGSFLREVPVFDRWRESGLLRSVDHFQPYGVPVTHCSRSSFFFPNNMARMGEEMHCITQKRL